MSTDYTLPPTYSQQHYDNHPHSFLIQLQQEQCNN